MANPLYETMTEAEITANAMAQYFKVKAAHAAAEAEARDEAASALRDWQPEPDTEDPTLCGVGERAFCAQQVMV